MEEHMPAETLLRSLKELFAWGTVGANGTPLNEGSKNWRASKQENGLYLITVDGSFANVPVVVVSGYRTAGTAGAADNSHDNAYTTRVLNKDAFEVHSYGVATGGSSGVRQDSPFSFIAICRL
jgi:hypothetical protein